MNLTDSPVYNTSHAIQALDGQMEGDFCEDCINCLDAWTDEPRHLLARVELIV